MVTAELINYISKNSLHFVSPVKTRDLVSFKVGGTGDIAVFPKSVSELKCILDFVKNERFVLLGNGTNCYFTEGNFDDVIIVTSLINGISLADNAISAECGVSIKDLCTFAMENGLSGLEFAYGIPGTVGGAVCMNASAFGGCFADVVHCSTVYDFSKSNEHALSKNEHCFGTKTSIFRASTLSLLSTQFKLKCGEKGAIKAKMDEYLARRELTQPLDFPSAGSTFVKPADSHASFLVDKAGLKGFCIGGAAVSDKHAGFIVNLGGARSSEINELINHIKTTVKSKFNVSLQEEIIYLE